MRLLTNLGNSDVWDDIGWTFRVREQFLDRTQSLVSALKHWEGVCALDGTLNPSLRVYDAQDKQYKTISRLSFHILRHSIDQIERLTGQPVTEVCCFCTKQKNPKAETQDTYSLYQLLTSKIGLGQFPGVAFSQIVVRDDPSDYQAMVDFYEMTMKAMEEKPSVVLIAQATPAMGYALSRACADHHPLFPQYYVAWKRSEGIDTSKVSRLALFSRESLSSRIHGFCSLLEHGEYIAAKTSIKDSPLLLEMIPGLSLLVSYLDHRSRYLFDEAREDLAKLCEVDGNLWNLVQPFSLGLDQFQKCQTPDGQNLDCMNDSIAYLLYESLQNAMFEFAQGRLYLSIAFLFSFFDTFQVCIAGRLVLHEQLSFEKKTRSYSQLDEFINEKVIPSLDSTVGMKNEHKGRLRQRWRKGVDPDNPGKASPIGFDGPTPYHFFDWAAHQPEASPQIREVFLFYQKNEKIIGQLRNLRNKSPIAHSVNGISEDEINATAGGDYLQILDDTAKTLWCLLPDGAVPSRPYHQIAGVIRRQLEEVLGRMI